MITCGVYIQSNDGKEKAFAGDVIEMELKDGDGWGITKGLIVEIRIGEHKIVFNDGHIQPMDGIEDFRILEKKTMSDMPEQTNFFG